jgi:hypothetical protein
MCSSICGIVDCCFTYDIRLRCAPDEALDIEVRGKAMGSGKECAGRQRHRCTHAEPGGYTIRRRQILGVTYLGSRDSAAISLGTSLLYWRTERSRTAAV